MSGHGSGRQSGTMGESTRTRLAALIQAAKSGGDGGAGAAAAGGDRPISAGVSVGGYQGGLGGTWGRAATGRTGSGSGQAPTYKPSYHSPILGGQALRREAPLVAARKHEILAEFTPSLDRVPPASSGAQNMWHKIPPKPYSLPGTSPKLTNRTRPRIAGARLYDSMDHHQQQQRARPDTAQATREYRLRGSKIGIGGPSSNRAAAGVHDSCDASSSFPASPDAGTAAAAGSFSFGADAGQQHSSNQRPVQARSFNKSSSQAAGGGAAAASDLSEARLATLEDAIRDALRTRRSVYEDSKTLLLRLFKGVDDGSGDVEIDEFMGVCAQLGVSVSQAEAAALFRRAGYDKVMPYQKWAHAFINQPLRQMASESAVRKGAFQPGQSANFSGKIIYEECRKPVWTPTNWDPQLADHSADLPDVRLSLEFAYGYAGAPSTSQNLFYNCKGQVVYFLAGVGVVYHKQPEHCQHFYLGHVDDIKSLALCPADVACSDQHYPAKSLVATGQVSSHEDGPTICVWDSRVSSPGLNPTAEPPAAPAEPQIAKIQLDKELRGIVAVGFSPDGSMLACVATDNNHSVTVYDWRAGWRILGEGKGCMGEPPQVFGLEWNPHQLTHHIEPQFVTYGKKNLKLWRQGGPKGGSWTATQLSFGKLPLQNVMSAAFLTPRGQSTECILVAGMADGQVYLFKGITPMSAIAAHKPGPRSIQPDGQPAYEGLRGMRLCRNNKTLLTGGADGVIVQWDVADGSMAEGKFAGPSITLKHPYGSEKPPFIRSLDFQDVTSGGNILVGTLDSCVWEVSTSGAQQDVLVAGHASDVWAVACHPANPNMAATACDGNKIYVWDLQARVLARCASVGFVCRALTFSPVPYGSAGGAGDGSYHIAVGGAKGHIRVVTELELRPVWEGRDSTQGISELDYSPDGKLLAAATFDAWIDVYNVEKGYQRIARCGGHSATVRCIDWSVDSTVLQSNCAAREILYWNARTGKQMPSSCRDVQWSSWTCLYGFPVMGIWPDCADGSDINACDRSKSSKYLATCDDHGLVKLFNYPVVIEDAPHRAYRGHSSHVMCVRFNSDDSIVCSTGGKDWAMFQFKVVPVSAGENDVAVGAADGVGRLRGSAGQGLKGALPSEMVWGPLDASGCTFVWVPASSIQQPAAAATPQSTGMPGSLAASAAGIKAAIATAQLPATSATAGSFLAGEPQQQLQQPRNSAAQAAAGSRLQGSAADQQQQRPGVSRYDVRNQTSIDEEDAIEDEVNSFDDEA